MPVYDYKCHEHGVFYALATLDESSAPKPCPECGELSARIIIISPHLAKLKKEEMTAHARNEKAQFEPQFSTPESRKEAHEKHAHQHGSGCGCSEHKKNKSMLFYTAEGHKTFPSMRPWMISH